MRSKKVKLHGLYDIEVPINIAEKFEDELLQIYVLASILGYSIEFKQETSDSDISNKHRATYNRFYINGQNIYFVLSFFTDCHGLLSITLLACSPRRYDVKSSYSHFDLLSFLKDAL